MEKISIHMAMLLEAIRRGWRPYGDETKYVPEAIAQGLIREEPYGYNGLTHYVLTESGRSALSSD